MIVWFTLTLNFWYENLKNCLIFFWGYLASHTLTLEKIDSSRIVIYNMYFNLKTDILLNLSLKIVVLEHYYPILSENMYNIHSNLLFWCRLLELQSAPLFTVEPHRRSRSVWDCTVLWNCRSFDIYIVFSSVILHLFSLCFSVEECTYTLLQLKCHRPPRNPFVFVVAFAHAVALLLLCCAATVHCKYLPKV